MDRDVKGYYDEPAALNHDGLPMAETPKPSLRPDVHRRARVVFFANTDWYLYNFRSPLAHRVAQRFDADIWVACPDGPYRKPMEAEGFRWIPVEMRRRSLNPVYDIVTAWRLSRVLRGIQPDLLHAFTLKSVFIGTLAAWMAGVPRVVNAVTGLGTLYGTRNGSYTIARGLLAVFFWIFLTQRWVRTIFQNPEDLRQIEALVGHGRTFRLILGSGVDTLRFHPSGETPLPPVVLMASRLTQDKGIRVLCRAARLVQAGIPEVQFWIAGEVDPGNPTSFVQEEIKGMAEEYPMVQFLGHRADMAELYRVATVAVLPAQAREGLPRCLIEACATGLPIVASDVEGVRNVVFHGRNGFLVPPGDALALASALLDVLKSPARRMSMGRESRALALTHFDQEKVMESTLAVYQELGLRPALQDVYED